MARAKSSVLSKAFTGVFLALPAARRDREHVVAALGYCSLAIVFWAGLRSRILLSPSSPLASIRHPAISRKRGVVLTGGNGGRGPRADRHLR